MRPSPALWPLFASLAVSTLVSCNDDLPDFPYSVVTDVQQTQDGRLLVAGYGAPCQCDTPGGFIEFVSEDDGVDDLQAGLVAGEVPGEATIPPIWGVTECAPGEFVGVTGNWSPFTVVQGPEWETVDLSKEWILVDVTSSSCDDIVAVGRFAEDEESDPYGVVVAFDGETWSEVELPEGVPPLAAVWRGDLGTFAVGDEGTILSFDGESWTRMDAPTEVNLRGVWGTADRVYVVGGAAAEEYVVLEYAESEWTVVAEGAGTLLGVDGRADDDIYAVGGAYNSDTGAISCTLLHFDGDDWVDLACDYATYYYEVSAMSDGRTYVGGPDATLQIVDD